jgi:anti-sigma factor RsiW
MTASSNPPNPPDSPGPAKPALSDAQLDAALRGLNQHVLQEDLPSALQQAAQRLDGLQQQASRSRNLVGLAAGLLLAFGVGWLGHAQLSGAGGAALAGRAAEREFVRQASFAYSVYQPEKRHPVEVAADQQEHLVQWLSKRLGKPLKVPHLEPLGFELVGGRLLPGDAGARAQFMFQNAAGQRITLYLGALEKGSRADREASQFRLESDGAVPSFYWAEQGFGYALSGQIDQATLMALADRVYGQISRD